MRRVSWIVPLVLAAAGVAVSAPDGLRAQEAGGGTRPPKAEARKEPAHAETPTPEDADADAKLPAAGIQWFATWKQGLAEAKRTGRPILLVAAAPQCHSISGLW